MRHTFYEILRIATRPFGLPIYYWTYKTLKSIVGDSNPSILDVGGRRSPYTIGLKAKVTISDLPRETEAQFQLNLGVDAQIKHALSTRRSNVNSIVLDDLVDSRFESNTFDGISAIEVIEHVENDGLFIEQAARLLKPGGFLLLTTPNGHWVKNNNPDHKRHYQFDELKAKLTEHLSVEWIYFLICDGFTRRYCTASINVKRPIRSAAGIFVNLLGMVYSLYINRNRNNPKGKIHLVALARKSTK